MPKPHWELKHDWWLEDIRFELEQIWAWKLMLRQVADKPAGDILRGTIKLLDKRLDWIKRAYKKIYGGRPNITKMRREVERC